jgi:hypothetical protein
MPVFTFAQAVDRAGALGADMIFALLACVHSTRYAPEGRA